jgi:flagellar operon protein
MKNSEIHYNRVITSGRVAGTYSAKPIESTDKKSQNQSFEKILQGTMERERNIRFSRHAQERMLRRNIFLSHMDVGKITKAMEKAQEKGVKDSLILMGNLAFIVNIPSKTVVTAIDGENIKQNIFTNIDGAVIL